MDIYPLPEVYLKNTFCKMKHTDFFKFLNILLGSYTLHRYILINFLQLLNSIIFLS